MSTVQRNIVANFVGKIWTVLVSLAFIPLYIRFLGIESYGLVGVYTSLTALFSVLDLGLSTTLNRELARASAQPGGVAGARNIVRTLEVVYWAIAAVIGLTVAALAPVATHWLNADQLSPTTLRQAFVAMGFSLAVQWPFSLYAGGLMGLQRQLHLNVITVITATLRGAGAVAVLWLIAPTVQAFFVWQVLVNLLQTAITAYCLWGQLPGEGFAPRFRMAVLREVWRFAAGMTGISVLALMLTQSDKIVLSKVLTLEKFGYYTLAGTVAGGFSYLVAPIFTALFPRFSEMVVQGGERPLSELYHRGCQLVSFAILPVAAILVFFSREVLSLWVRDPAVVQGTYQVLALLVIGNALLGLMNLPYALQLAHGWTSLVTYMNLGAVFVLVPLTLVMALRYGAIGAALVWILLNVGYVLIDIQLMHRRLLKGEQWGWYFTDIGPPMIAAVAVAGLGRAVFPAHASRMVSLLSLTAFTTLAFLATGFFTPSVREWVVGRVGRRHLVAAAKTSYEFD